MGRPRILKTKWGGEVVLRNVGPEVADKLKAVLDGDDSTTDSSTGDVEIPVEVPKEPVTFTHSAVGTYKKDNAWYVVEVKYNPVTGEGKVEQNRRVGEQKAYAIDAFKILAAEKELV